MTTDQARAFAAPLLGKLGAPRSFTQSRQEWHSWASFPWLLGLSFNR